MINLKEQIVTQRRHHGVMYHARTLLCIISLVYLTGCASVSGIQPEAKIQTPDSGAAAQNKPDIQWLDAKWWQGLDDEQLNRLMDQGTANSPTLRQADARVRRAIASAGVTRSENMPSVDANADMSYHRWPMDHHYGGGLFGEGTWDNTANLQFSYHMDFFGRQKNRDLRSQAGIAFSMASQRAATLQLEGNLLRSYIQLALDYRQLDVEHARLAQQQQIVALNRQRLDSGLGSQYDLKQSQALLPVTRRRITALDADIALTKNQLITLAGLSLDQTANIKRPTIVLTDKIALPDALPVNLLGHRPDLVAGRWQIVSAARGIDLTQADFYPNINLQAMVGQMMTLGTLVNWFDKSNRAYSIGPALSLPIFDGGARRARLGIATADYDDAIEGYNAALQNALRDVSDQLIRHKSMWEQSALANEGVQRANQVYETAKAAFRRGLRDYLHVLDAQSRLFDQQIACATVRARLMRAQVDLAIAMGGGVTFKYTPDPRQLLPGRTVKKRLATQAKIGNAPVQDRQ